MGAAILCVGALTLDAVYRVPELPAAPRKYLASEAFELPAGMAASAAIAAARLGGRPRLLASVGTDRAGRELIDGLTAAGVDCAEVRRVPGGRSATAVVVVAPDGERVVVAHYPDTNRPPPPRMPDTRDIGAVLVDTRWPEAAEAALIAARAAGLPAILDADTAPIDVLHRLAARAGHVIASRHGGQLLTGEHDPEAAARRLLEAYGGVVAVTAGAQGCWWSDGNAVRHAPAPRVAVVDTNAAGDVFHGAFALALAEGQPPDRAVRFAVHAAALKCTRSGGALGTPGRSELDALMSRGEPSRD